MMKNFIKINNPCPENWDSMQDSLQGKFCEKCSKCVIDFTDKTDQEIQDILTDAKGKNLCGRISSFSKIAAGLILVTNLSFVQAQIYNNEQSVENRVEEGTKVSGRLIFKETQKVIPNAEVIFISKEKLIKTTTNENGYFSLKIPSNLLKENNVLYFDFDKINNLEREKKKGRDTLSAYDYENQPIIFSKKEKIENRKFEINYQEYLIGAVVIITPQPPNYYYFNGKAINKEKFEKLRKNNLNYKHFSFEGRTAEVISHESFIDTLYLLYSD